MLLWDGRRSHVNDDGRHAVLICRRRVNRKWPCCGSGRGLSFKTTLVCWPWRAVICRILLYLKVFMVSLAPWLVTFCFCPFLWVSDGSASKRYIATWCPSRVLQNDAHPPPKKADNKPAPHKGTVLAVNGYHNSQSLHLMDNIYFFLSSQYKSKLKLSVQRITTNIFNSTSAFCVAMCDEYNPSGLLPVLINR